IIGSVIPPRDRGRYNGYLGATMAVATISGPLIGGVIVDTSWLGWRWCFFVCVPFTLISLVILARYLRVPTIKREVRIDYVGAVLISIAASLPLIWVSFAGSSFGWLSVETVLFLGGALIATCAAVYV